MNELERSLAFSATPEELARVKELPVDQLPTISVVVPSYNQARFLPATLDSILAQDYPRLDIFIADGGSSDDSPRILAEYAARHPDLMRYDSRPDGGHYQGVNKAIANTRGEIVAWINSDDVYLPEAFWKIATFFHYNRCAFVVYGRNRYVNEQLELVTEYPVDWSPLLAEQRRRMLHFCTVPQPSLFFRRIAVTLCGALASPILDYELWLRWQKELPFYFYDDYLSLSRLHDQAITANANPALLLDICATVHRYYGGVPFSWAFKAAHTTVHGAAWARGETHVAGAKVRWLACWYFLWLNVKLLPLAIARLLRSAAAWLRQMARISA